MPDPFWEEKVGWTTDPRFGDRVVRVEHKHYLVGPEKPAGGLRGFSGARWCIQWLDESRGLTVTTNLWHQGTIPPEYWDALPDNARFLNAQQEAEARDD